MDDDEVEGDEIFNLVLESIAGLTPHNAGLGPSVTVTIVDNDRRKDCCNDHDRSI
jgi:hypothetical protein